MFADLRLTLKGASLTGIDVDVEVLKSEYEEFVSLLFSENVTTADKVMYRNKLVYTHLEFASLTKIPEENAGIYLKKAIALIDRRIEFVEMQILSEIN